MKQRQLLPQRYGIKMAKATHTGICQVCGATQKLPKGVLSRHGYTLDFGWQMGTCTGAGELPFEQSCELVKESIENAKKEIERAEAHIEEVAEDDETVWLEAIHYQGRRIIRQWVQLEDDEIKANDSGRMLLYDRLADRWKYANDSHPDRFQASQRDLYIRAKRSHIGRVERYVEFQQKRLEGWEVQPLTPVENT